MYQSLDVFPSCTLLQMEDKRRASGRGRGAPGQRQGQGQMDQVLQAGYSPSAVLLTPPETGVRGGAVLWLPLSLGREENPPSNAATATSAGGRERGKAKFSSIALHAAGTAKEGIADGKDKDKGKDKESLSHSLTSSLVQVQHGGLLVPLPPMGPRSGSLVQNRSYPSTSSNASSNAASIPRDAGDSSLQSMQSMQSIQSMQSMQSMQSIQSLICVNSGIRLSCRNGSCGLGDPLVCPTNPESQRRHLQNFARAVLLAPGGSSQITQEPLATSVVC